MSNPSIPNTENLTWSPDDVIAEADIEETFKQCPHCGTYVVQYNGAHSCAPAEQKPNRNSEELRNRIEANSFPDDDPVLVRKHKRYNTYVYHEPDNDGTPLCSISTDQSFLTRTRKHAHFLALCQRCQRICEKQEADQ